MEPNRNDPKHNSGGDPQKPKGMAWGKLLIALAIVLIISSVYNYVKKSQYTETTFSDFMAAFEAEQLAEVELHADRVIYMENGLIVEDGPAQEVLGANRSAAIRAFAGDSAY